MKVFIGCGAQEGLQSDYLKLSYDISNHLASQGYDLVFGCYSKSMMGESYKAFRENNRKIYACVPENCLSDLEGIEGIVQKYPTAITRSEGIYETADVLLFLPGGTGSLAELFSFISENSNREVKKKIIVYNYQNHFTGLLSWLEEIYQKNFLSKKVLDLISVVNNEEDLYKLIEEEN